MKKAILVSVLGMAFSGLTAFGQGSIRFSNYSSTVYNPVVYGYAPPGIPGAGPAGKNVDDPNVELQLFYLYGTVSMSPAAFLAAATPGLTTFINRGINGGGQYGTPTSIGSPGGYYNGGVQYLWDWQPGETVTFMVAAWDSTKGDGTLGGALSSGGFAGFTSMWQEVGVPPGQNGIQPIPLPAESFAAGPPVLFYATMIPEPATLACAGLGLLSLLALARWKKV